MSDHQPKRLPNSVMGSNKPDRKVVAAAVATIGVFVASQLGLPIPTGVEGAVAVIVAYFWPN